MTKVTKVILGGCGIGLLTGGILLGAGLKLGGLTYQELENEEVRLEEDAHQESGFMEEMMKDMDIEIEVDGVDVLSDILANVETEPTNVNMVDSAEKLEAFEKISIDTDIAGIKLVKGEEYKVSYKYPEEELPEIKVSGDTLHIKHKQKIDLINNSEEDSRTIVITIPEEAILKDIQMDNYVGTVYITDMVAENCDITVKTGDVEVQNCKFTECVVSNSVGEITITDSEAEMCEITAKTGDVNVENCRLEKCIAESNVGTVSVDLPDKLGAYTIEVSTNVGTTYVNDEEQEKEYRAEGTGTGEIHASVNIGDITISGK